MPGHPSEGLLSTDDPHRSTGSADQRRLPPPGRRVSLSPNGVPPVTAHRSVDDGHHLLETSACRGIGVAAAITGRSGSQHWAGTVAGHRLVVGRGCLTDRCGCLRCRPGGTLIQLQLLTTRPTAWSPGQPDHLVRWPTQCSRSSPNGGCSISAAGWSQFQHPQRHAAGAPSSGRAVVPVAAPRRDGGEPSSLTGAPARCGDGRCHTRIGEQSITHHRHLMWIQRAQPSAAGLPPGLPAVKPNWLVNDG